MSTIADVKADSPFLGTWRNTNPKSTGIAEATFAVREGILVLRVCGGASANWFEARAEVFFSDDATAPEKIMVQQDLHPMEVLLHGWIKQGVLVLAIFRRFKGEDRCSNYFDREFFYRANGPR
jgi:hypothetical protein